MNKIVNKEGRRFKIPFVVLYIVHSAAAATVAVVWASIMSVIVIQWSREFSVSFNVWEPSTLSRSKCFLVYLSALSGRDCCADILVS